MPRRGDDPDDDFADEHSGREERDERGFSFRQRLSEGITGLLDPDGALGKSRDYVTDLAQGTKTEVVRMVSREVRSFLDQMDTVDLMQQVIAGLVIDVNAQIRFSFEDKDGKRQLSPNIVHKETRVHSERRRQRDNGRDEKNARSDKRDKPKSPETED